MNEHTCHARDCKVEIPPKLFMCKKHWYMVPPEVRKEIWILYRPGQEVDKQPSDKYLAAATKAVRLVAAKEAA